MICPAAHVPCFVEQSNIGFTVLFLPLSTQIERFGLQAEAELKRHLLAPSRAAERLLDCRKVRLQGAEKIREAAGVLLMNVNKTLTLFVHYDNE
jgi:hypothetical protein